MIYWADVKHGRRTYSPEYIMPESHDLRKHPLFLKRPIRLPDEQFTRNPSVAVWATGEFVDPQLSPAWIKLQTTEKVVEDLYDLYGRIFVSARVKDKIVELEPDVHRFVPVRLLQNDGSEPWGEYYFFNIRQHAFSVDEEKSPYYKWVARPNPYSALKLMNLTRMPVAAGDKSRGFKVIHLVYKADVVGNKIVWREKLDLDMFPNTGTRRFSQNPNGSVTVKDINPDKPTVAVYFIEDEFWFRLTETVKAWMDSHDVMGLDCSRFPGVLDTGWPGVV